MAMGGGPDHALWAAGAGEPDVRVRLLHGQHPGVHRPIVVVLPLIPEGARGGPALDDEVVGLFEALAVLRGVDATLEGLHGGAAHKPGDDPAAGKAVQHGNLFRHPDGIIDGDDVSQDGDLGFFGDLGDDGRVQVYGGLHAPVGGMVLVAHDAVEAHFIGQGVLLMVLIVEHMRLLGVNMGVGETETPRRVLFQVGVGDVAVGLFRKPVDLYAVLGSGELFRHDCLLLAILVQYSTPAPTSHS